MKKLLLIAIFCVVTIALQAQKYEQGYYINQTDQRFEGLLSFEKYNDYLLYKINDSTSRKRIDIKDIKMVVTASPHADTLVVKIDSEGVDNTTRYFAAIYLDSPYRIYKMYKERQLKGSTTMSPNAAGVMEMRYVGVDYKLPDGYDLMIEQNGVTVHLTRKMFKTIMPVIVKDFPGLARQTQDGTYGLSDMETIISVYKRLKQMKAEGKDTNY